MAVDLKRLLQQRIIIITTYHHHCNVSSVQRIIIRTTYVSPLQRIIINQPHINIIKQHKVQSNANDRDGQSLA
ncbi:predicted protein [Lichtheimia corymbifera JMRC:FSU:9682]|uniref:Uncharacterized protein n=1 Tax=Lichtheimia corymbifera JMRC:FSU:9682 TaxID=1263082 RepID=A0A068RRP6_9FUNG|nr:predicted protein [Lichtheimia corymbifera JMRC:FSU:9682]